MLPEGHFQQLLELSERMLAAGMAQQWDDLVSLEQQRQALLDKTPTAAATDKPQPLIELIHQIQACDTQLREKLDAWMTHARILLRLDTPPSPTP